MQDYIPDVGAQPIPEPELHNSPQMVNESTVADPGPASAATMAEANTAWNIAVKHTPVQVGDVADPAFAQALREMQQRESSGA